MRGARKKDIPPLIRARSLGMAFLTAATLAMGSGSGDFCPLAVGNVWVYSIEEYGGAFDWNPSVNHRIARTLRVESRAEGPGGDAVHVLSYRDSLHNRKRTPDQGSTASAQLPDSVRTGRFQVIESAGDGRLTLRASGHPIPPGMEAFFRQRSRSGGIATLSRTGDSLLVVRVVAHYHRALRDDALYAQGLGLLRFHRNYDIWGVSWYTLGYKNSTSILQSFNGRPVSLPESFRIDSVGILAGGFTGLKRGRSWRYRGLRQEVPRYDTRIPRRDSVLRELVVTDVSVTGGDTLFRLSLKDSLHHRALDGQTRADTVRRGTLSVTRKSGDPLNTVSASVGSGDLADEMAILFNRNAFLEEALDMRDFGAGPVRVWEYREGMPGLLEDTLVRAEGIGLVRRSKYLQAIRPGYFEHLDWRLIELDGKPFDPFPLATHRAREAPPGRKAVGPSAGRKTWRWRDLLGRFRRP